MSKHRTAAPLALVSAMLLSGWTAFHLELQASHPAADAVLEEAPTEIWLHFSVVPDMERTSFSVRGPAGAVKLGDIVVGDEPQIVKAVVEGEMPAGAYTLSWVGAPPDDHTVRGRFAFSIQETVPTSR